MNDPIKSIYIDTSAISKMADKGLWRLLAASKAGKLNVFISEVVIWEKTKARHKLAESSLFYDDDKGIPLNAATFKKTLQVCDVNIIEHTSAIIKKAEEFIEDKRAQFDLSNTNELRDAHIMAAASCELDIRTIIASNDGDFIRRIPILLPGFSTISQDAIVNFSETEGIKKPERNPSDFGSLTEEQIKSPFSQSFLSVLPMIDPESFDKYNNDLEKVNIHNNNLGRILTKSEPITNEFGRLETFLSKTHAVDNEIKKRVLGYTQWFSNPPISKKDLYQLLETDRYGREEIENNAQRLKQENILVETENYWLTNTRNSEAAEICDQAMAILMPEIIELMERS